MEAFEGQIRDIYGRVVYTHKTHLKCADQLLVMHHQMKTAQIWLSALTTSGTVTTLIADHLVTKIATAIISLALLILNSLVKGYNYGEVAQKHIEAANQLWDVRESYQSLLADISDNRISSEGALKRREELQREFNKVNSSSPPTTSRAYLAAQKALKNDEEFTFSASEIDHLLPPELRSSKAVGNQIETAEANRLSAPATGPITAAPSATTDVPPHDVDH
jgi:hypothetical protein